MRYYAPHRPITPGSYPKPADLKVLEIHNFEDPEKVPGISRKVWGWIEYDGKLRQGEIDAYELIPERSRTRSDSMVKAQDKYRKTAKAVTLSFNVKNERDKAVYERIREESSPKAYIIRLILDDMARNPKPDSE